MAINIPFWTCVTIEGYMWSDRSLSDHFLLRTRAVHVLPKGRVHIEVYSNHYTALVSITVEPVWSSSKKDKPAYKTTYFCLLSYLPRFISMDVKCSIDVYLKNLFYLTLFHQRIYQSERHCKLCGWFSQVDTIKGLIKETQVPFLFAKYGDCNILCHILCSRCVL